MPQPPSGASVMSTHVRSTRQGSPAAAAMMSVISFTMPSCLLRSRTNGRQDLDADVIAVTGSIRQRFGIEVVDERRCVVQEQRDLGYAFPPHHGRGKVLCQPRSACERSRRGVHVDHRHGVLSFDSGWLSLFGWLRTGPPRCHSSMDGSEASRYPVLSQLIRMSPYRSGTSSHAKWPAGR